MEEMMMKVGRAMSIRMGIAMSFCLSLVGTLTSGHFTPIGFVISFVISSIISLLIGFIIPMGKVSEGARAKAKLERGSIKARLLETFISDLIYTPVITLAMVFFAYKMAMKQSGGAAQLNFWGMFLSSLAICFVAGFILIFLVQPIFMKGVMKKYGMNGMGNGGAPGPQGPRKE
ncbi:hypothetical protein [Butyrivibrio sp. AE2032]|uniref:hypothetical protein n=1 Tax=Butyrivibrio sp. AE2032 TaxID=1458463 RepID=UPI0006903873|nr:hypothetical protein [Butyrivibrio sp. AE2032]